MGKEIPEDAEMTANAKGYNMHQTNFANQNQKRSYEITWNGDLIPVPQTIESSSRRAQAQIEGAKAKFSRPNGIIIRDGHLYDQNFRKITIEPLKKKSFLQPTINPASSQNQQKSSQPYSKAPVVMEYVDPEQMQDFRNSDVAKEQGDKEDVQMQAQIID